jgi:hypothetical protein
MSGYYLALYSTGEEKIHEEKTEAWRKKQRQPVNLVKERR